MTRRNLLPAAILLILALTPAFTLEKPEVFLGTSGGVLSGIAHELVYQQNKKLSELIWPLELIPVFSLENILRWNRFHLDSELTVGIPGKTGTMTDADFLNVNINGSTARTHYSESDNYLNHLVQIDLSGGLTLKPPINNPFSSQTIKITPSIGFRYFSVKWTAKDGFLQYENPVNAPSLPGGVYVEWTKNTPKTPMTGDVISYKQDYYIPSLGVSASIPFGQKAILNIGLRGTPFLWCNDLDKHLAKKVDYYDYLSGGYMIEPSGLFSWTIKERTTFYTEAKWTKIDHLRGKTLAVNTITNTGSWYNRENGGGASYEELILKIGITTQLR